MGAEDFLKDVCPNHTDNSKWNKSELIHILKLYKESFFCPCSNLPDGEIAISSRVLTNPFWKEENNK